MVLTDQIPKKLSYFNVEQTGKLVVAVLSSQAGNRPALFRGKCPRVRTMSLSFRALKDMQAEWPKNTSPNLALIRATNRRRLWTCESQTLERNSHRTQTVPTSPTLEEWGEVRRGPFKNAAKGVSRSNKLVLISPQAQLHISVPSGPIGLLSVPLLEFYKQSPNRFYYEKSPIEFRFSISTTS